MSLKFILATLVFLLSIVTPMASAEEPLSIPDLLNCELLENLGQVSIETKTDGTVDKVIKVDNPEEFVKKFDPDIIGQVKDVTIYIPEIPVERPLNLNADEIKALGSVYIKPTSETNACASSSFRETYYDPPEGEMVVTESFEASFSTNVDVSAEIISAGVGFSVTRSYSVSDKQKIIVPSGRVGLIKAYEYYRLVRFDVMEKGFFGDKKIGDGYALKPIGICFKTYIL